MDIIQDLTEVNFTKLGMKEIRGIVLHSMWGTYQGSIAWFKNPDAKASAHYLISEKGEIRQMVRDTDMAWHAGVYDEPIPDFLRPNPNFYTIGIELEDRRDVNWAYPQVQRDATAWLIDMLLRKYGLSKDRVFLHRELNPSRRSDPVGQFSREWALAKFNEPAGETDVERGVRIIKEYRSQRTTPNGPEGNFEGFIRAVIGNDQLMPSKLAEIISLQDAVGKTKTELAQQIAMCDQKLDDNNKNWQIKVDYINKQLEVAPTYTLNLASPQTLFLALLNRILKQSKTKDELDAQFGVKGVIENV